MIKAQRQAEILKLLEQNNTMSISALATALDSSLMTIRRDLDEMEKRNTVKKVYGGAVLFEKDDVQPSFDKRIHQNMEEKNRIAQEAVTRIKNDDVVFFDAGTTPLCVAKKIPPSMRFTAITNSLMTAAELCGKPNVNVIMLGGEMHHSSYSAVNSMPIRQLENFHADIALISTKAFSYPDGLFESILPLIEIKKTFVRCADKVILLADHSKFETKSLCASVPLDELDELITDDKVPQKEIEQLKESNIEVTVVHV